MPWVFASALTYFVVAGVGIPPRYSLYQTHSHRGLCFPAQPGLQGFCWQLAVPWAVQPPAPGWAHGQ